MRGVVIFGVGSTLVVDLEEGLRRAGTPVAAAVANVPGDVHLLDRAPLIQRDQVTTGIFGIPYLVPLFTPANRYRASLDAKRLGFTTPHRFLDTSVAAPESLEGGSGLWVNTGVILGAASRFGSFVLVNRGASIGHHARLGEFTSIGPGAVLAGEVTAGMGAMIGAGAVVLPQITIGAHATVAAGSVVTHDVPDRCLVAGSPARVVRDDLEGFEADAGQPVAPPEDRQGTR